MRDARDFFIASLRDAHAMELQAKDVMRLVSGWVDDYPELAARASEHVQETEAQIERLRQCLDLLGESPSPLKDIAMRSVGIAQALLHAATSGEVIKDTLATVAFENFEVASYRSLIAFAHEIGEERMVPQLTESLREEEAMAKWMSEHVEPLTKEFCRITSIPGQIS